MPQAMSASVVPKIVRNIEWVLETWPKVYAAAPEAARPLLDTAAEHSDVVALGVIALLLVGTFGVRLRAPHWSGIVASGVIFGVLAALGFKFMNSIFYFQHEFHAAHNLTSEFNPILPLDFATSEYGIRNVTRLLLFSGDQGRGAYSAYLAVDCVNVLVFIWMHRTILSLFYRDDQDLGDFLLSLAYRLPSVYGALDMFENMSAASFLGWFEIAESAGKPFILSQQFVSHVSSATSYKFYIGYLIVGLEIAGLLKFVVERRWLIKHAEDGDEMPVAADGTVPESAAPEPVVHKKIVDEEDTDDEKDDKDSVSDDDAETTENTPLKGKSGSKKKSAAKKRKSAAKKD
ncbi:hypothetical protein BC831DRAFT_456766 [Entophlyctis helioformis]|nr:hypothetical protein BC831DRAFT_456766 [Entophlyctis helioformis]